MKCENGHYLFCAPRHAKRGAECPICHKPMAKVKRVAKRQYKKKGAEGR